MIRAVDDFHRFSIIVSGISTWDLDRNSTYRISTASSESELVRSADTGP